MIKSWNTTEIGDKVIMRTTNGSVVYGSIVGFIRIGGDIRNEITVVWDIDPEYQPQYDYPRRSNFGGHDYVSRMFFYTEPHEELVGKLKLSDG